MNLCRIQACPIHVPNEPRSGFYKSTWDRYGICHTHWFMLPPEIRSDLKAKGNSSAAIRAVEWHQEDVIRGQKERAAKKKTRKKVKKK